MVHWIKILSLLIVMGLLLEFPTLARAQAKNSDNQSLIVKSQTDSVKTGAVSKTKPGEDEIELSEINIEAVIEKPRVAIIPRRLEPEFDEMELINRSFENELKKAPAQPMLMDDRLLLPKKIENWREKLFDKKKNLEHK